MADDGKIVQFTASSPAVAEAARRLRERCRVADTLAKGMADISLTGLDAVTGERLHARRALLKAALLELAAETSLDDAEKYLVTLIGFIRAGVLPERA